MHGWRYALRRRWFEPRIGCPSSGDWHGEDKLPWLVGGIMGLTEGPQGSWTLLKRRTQCQRALQQEEMAGWRLLCWLPDFSRLSVVHLSWSQTWHDNTFGKPQNFYQKATKSNDESTKLQDTRLRYINLLFFSTLTMKYQKEKAKKKRKKRKSCLKLHQRE